MQRKRELAALRALPRDLRSEGDACEPIPDLHQRWLQGQHQHSSVWGPGCRSIRSGTGGDPSPGAYSNDEQARDVLGELQPEQREEALAR